MHNGVLFPAMASLFWPSGQEYMAVSHRRLFSRFVRSQSFAVPYMPPIRRLKLFPYWALAFCQPKLNLFAWHGPSLAGVE